MCVNLHLPDGRVVASYRELTSLMAGDGPPPLVNDFAYLDGMEEAIICLCPLDMDAVALVMGWQLEWKAGDPHATRRCDA
jgi:hypothetical protein